MQVQACPSLLSDVTASEGAEGLRNPHEVGPHAPGGDLLQWFDMSSRTRSISACVGQERALVGGRSREGPSEDFRRSLRHFRLRTALWLQVIDEGDIS